MRLRSNDYRDKPAVDPRYFTDPEGHDMAVAVAGIRLAREIVSQPAMAAWAGRELAPGEQAQTDEEIADYVRRTHNTVYHPVGSVRMGAEDDAMSPLDARLRVKGVTGLRLTTTQMRRAPRWGPAATAFGGGPRAGHARLRQRAITRRRSRRRSPPRPHPLRPRPPPGRRSRCA